MLAVAECHLWLAHGATYIGRMHGLELPPSSAWSTYAMAPVFELRVTCEQQGKQMRTRYAAHPVLFLESIQRLPVPAGAALIPIDSLDPHDQSMLAAALAEGEAMAALMRSAKTGIVGPGGKPALRGLPGGKLQ